MIQSIYGKSWSFPRGKINKGESELDCAIRETFEETGVKAIEIIKDESKLPIVTMVAFALVGHLSLT